jgi:AcrR family transcriptional regulator
VSQHEPQQRRDRLRVERAVEMDPRRGELRGRGRPAQGRTRTPRATLTRDQVVEAAVQVLQTDGYPALSMRRVAQELGVGTMSLYWHVADRDELLDLVYDAVIGEQVLLDVPSDWRGALRSIAYATRAIFERYPWILDGGPRSRIGPIVLEHVEQTVAATESMDLPIETRLLASSLIDHFVLGFSMEEHARRAGWDHPELTEAAQEGIDAGRYPRAAELLDQLGHHAGRAPAQEFEVGLEVLLDGIAAMVARGSEPATDQPRKPARTRRRA